MQWFENQDTEANSAYNQIRTLDDSNEYIFSREYDANISGNNPQPGFSFPLGAEGWGIFQYSILLRTYTPTKELYNIMIRKMTCVFRKNNISILLILI